MIRRLTGNSIQFVHLLIIMSLNERQRTKKTKPFILNSNICMICASNNCRESTDHEFVSYEYLKELANNMKENNIQIEELKSSINQFYQSVAKKVKNFLQNECLKTLELLNHHYFNSLMDLEESDKKILSEVLQNDQKSIPSKKVYKLVRALHKTAKRRLQKFNQQICVDEISAIKRKLLEKIGQFNYQKFQLLLLSQIPKFSPLLQPQNYLTVGPKILEFSEEKSNQEDAFEWKNIRIRSIVKNVVLSCKKITDGQFLLNSPKLHKFTNINEFEARQNFITHLSCSSILNFLPQIISLDLRCNNIGDMGICKLKNLVNLKQLMICQNGIGNQSAKYILQGFSSLQILWVDENKITRQGALLLCEKPILKICSALGNPIQITSHQQIKNLFSKKGLIYL